MSHKALFMEEVCLDSVLCTVKPSGLRRRWVIPFSRQFLASAIGLTPLVPWAWKMALVKRWLISCYYRPCRMEHLIPDGVPRDMNYTGVYCLTPASASQS